MKTPLISVVIVHYNNKKLLEMCLPSIFEQDYKNYEVILVDNGSTDESLSFIKKSKYQNPNIKLKIVENRKNLGFAEGNNIGYKHASGEYIILLNNDTYVTKTYLSDFVKVFKENKKIGIAQSKIILTGNRGLDTCGSYWTDTSFLYYIGNHKNPDSPQYKKPFPIFAAKGASVIIKREVIEKIGLFDDDFWSYYEETDFCHRAWISGWETWYWPSATCFHAMGATSLKFKNDLVQFHNFKNKLCSYLKNLELLGLIKTVPVFLFFNLLLSAVWLLQGKWRHSLALFKAIWWNVNHFKTSFEKRKIIQKFRRTSDFGIWKIVKKNPSLSYYRYLFSDNLGAYFDK